MSARTRSLPLLLALALTGGAVSVPIATGHAATSAARAVARVSIQGFAFKPAILTIEVGTTVTWTNKDAVAHNVTAVTGRWHSNTLQQGQTYTYTFKKTGTYSYACTFHAGMTAKVIVAK